MPSSKASSTFVVIPRFFLHCTFNCLYVIKQMSDFHLPGIYTLFVYVVREVCQMCVYIVLFFLILDTNKLNCGYCKAQQNMHYINTID